MRAELLKLLDISERYNHIDRFRCISYGNREEYEEYKTEKLLNSKYWLKEQGGGLKTAASFFVPFFKENQTKEEEK